MVVVCVSSVCVLRASRGPKDWPWQDDCRQYQWCHHKCSKWAEMVTSCCRNATPPRLSVGPTPHTHWQSHCRIIRRETHAPTPQTNIHARTHANTHTYTASTTSPSPPPAPPTHRPHTNEVCRVDKRLALDFVCSAMGSEWIEGDAVRHSARRETNSR